MVNITESNYKVYLGKIATHAKAYCTIATYPNSSSQLPSVEALYGIYDSKSTAHITLCNWFGDISDATSSTPCTAIPRGFTVAVEENNTVVEYQYKKEMPLSGYTMADLEVKGITNVDASDVSYGSSNVETVLESAESNIQQLRSDVGDLSNLDTPAQNLVSAINSGITSASNSATAAAASSAAAQQASTAAVNAATSVLDELDNFPASQDATVLQHGTRITALEGTSVHDLSVMYSSSYANLSAALTALNADTSASAIKVAGMSIKFINSTTNKYEQWNLKSSSWSTNTSNWTLDADGSVTNGKLKLPFPLTKPNQDTFTINAGDIGYTETTIQPAEDEEEEGQQELVTIDHSSDTQHSSKSFWQKDGSAVMMNTNESISDKTIRALEEPIELLQGQTITITTAVHGLACNLFLVTDSEGNYLYKQAPAAAKTAETHVYVATEDCYVYVNTLTTKTFSCVVTYLTDGGSTPEPISELVTEDHTNDAFSETKAAWKLDDYNHIASIDSPSDNTVRKIITPISLLAGQKLKLTTATYSTTINMYIVTDANGDKITKKTPTAAKTAEYSEYTAENDCLVYINKLTTKDFSCVVEYTTEVTPDTPSSDTERPVIIVEEEISLNEKLQRVTQHIETLNGKMANLAETPSVDNHDDAAFVNSASVWVIDNGYISHNDSPSNSNARRIETAIPLTAEQQIVITTGAWGTAINAYIVTDSTGKVIAHKTVTANTGVQEYKYTAESNCLVYINKMTTRDFACSVSTSGGRLATIEANVESVTNASEAHSKSIAFLEENVESINAALNNIVDQITTVTDHTNDAFDTEASAWKIESGQITTIDSPSNPNTRKIITPIHLGIGKKIVLTTACYGTAINAYIVTDDEGNVIAHETVAAASAVETFHYTALSDCYVYVNKMINKDFSCVVQAVDYHAPENPDDLPTPETTDTSSFGNAVVELNVAKDYYLKGQCEQTFEAAYKKDTYTRYKIFALKGDYIKVKREATTSGYQCIVNLQFKDGFTTKTTLPVTTKTYNPCNATEEFVFAEMWDDVVELYIYHGSTTTAGTETITVTTYRQSNRMAEGSYQFGINANGFYHVQNIQALSEAMNLTNHEERLLSSWYGLYDALVSAYPNYVSKINCDDIMEDAGVEQPQALADKPIYMYKFIPASVNKATAGTSSTTMDKIPDHDRLKVLILTGTHPEYISMWDCYQMMRLICEEWKMDDNLAAMRWDAEFYIIPCTGPSGITSGARTNANGVDLNRNMPTWNWKVQGTMGDNTYSGASANSEYESQLLCKMIDEVKPNIFIDHHNYASTTSKMLIYVTAGKAMGWDAGAAHINLMSRKWQQEYSDVFPDNSIVNSSDLMFGFAQRCEAIGARVTYASQRGILAFTYESSASVNYANGEYSQGQPNYNALACTVATEGFLNFVLRICKTYSDNLSPKTFIM